MGERIILTERQVPVGARVNLYMPKNNEPEKMDGETMILRAMIGGVPARKKLYHLGEEDKILAGLEGFVEGTRFSPAEAYTPQDAPVGGKYAVYVNGRRMRKRYSVLIDGKWESQKHLEPVLVRKEEDGRLVGSNSYLYQWWMKEIPLPDGAQLVRIDK